MQLQPEDKLSITVSKIEAVTRHTDTAIRLWFHDEDDLVIHTIIAAAYQVVHDLNKKRHTDHESLFAASIIPLNRRGEWIKVVKKASNFFKHADVDASGNLQFFPISNVMLLLYAVSGIASLGERPTPYAHILIIWLFVHRPSFLTENGAKWLSQSISTEHVAALKGQSKKEFYDGMIKALQRTALSS